METMEGFKFIFRGRLDFGNQRGYDRALEMYDWKVMNHYKKDVQFDMETLFDEERLSAAFPRSLVLRGTPKNFEANKNLLDYLSQYAITGQMEMWMIDDKTRNVKDYKLVEPIGDRKAINSFTKGRELSVSEGKSLEALAALDEAIKKYGQHAQAYERRAHVNAIMGKLHEAERDYNKSIGIYAGAPEPYYGRGMLFRYQDRHEEAMQNFDTSIKRSIPLQPLHWKARRRKAESLMELGKYKEAAQELKFFTNRKFEPADTNHKYLRKAFFDYAYCLYELGQYKDAAILVDKALKQDEGKDAPLNEAMLYVRGISRLKAGMSNFEKDLKMAAKAGYPEAQAALEEVV